MNEAIAQTIHQFFAQYPKRTYPKGQIIVFADEDPEHIFYVESGKVRQYDTSYKGDEVVVNVFKPPAFFPMSSALNKTPNNFFYKTEEPTVLHVVPADEAVTFLKANPDVMLDLLSRLYRGMDGLLGRVVHLMSGTAKSRLMYDLIIECRRFGKAQPDGGFVLRASEQDIAARSGLTRETVSREMKKLKDKKLVEISKDGIKVIDLAALEKLIGTHI
jgi:CRP/FNR family transcriptional regulator